ncbi:MAG TPA: PIN domain-containing protein [Leptospiraceae bacterium]|nr:PIN domain-containing protein [Leptospiraceae bacterium]HNI95512.1 PIN domain-containing protein [Leptospiraceae bacterium]HNO22224.1 PIN domain-containing protein [Leptospiraceae bacterium]
MIENEIFIDTNILVYAKIDDTFPKHLKAKNLLNSLQQEIIISVQVLNELYISLNKIIKNDIEIKNILQSLILDCRVVPITLNTSVKVWEIKERYKFSFWDSLIISSALENNCKILYSEDMQNGQVIMDQLTIKNPLE